MLCKYCSASAKTLTAVLALFYHKPSAKWAAVKKVTSIPAMPSTCPTKEQGSYRDWGQLFLGTRHLPMDRDGLRLGLDVGPEHWSLWLGMTGLWGAGHWSCCIAGAGRVCSGVLGCGKGRGAPYKGVRDSQGWRSPQDTDNQLFRPRFEFSRWVVLGNCQFPVLFCFPINKQKTVYRFYVL